MKQSAAKLDPGQLQRLKERNHELMQASLKTETAVPSREKKKSELPGLRHYNSRWAVCVALLVSVCICGTECICSLYKFAFV